MSSERSTHIAGRNTSWKEVVGRKKKEKNDHTSSHTARIISSLEIELAREKQKRIEAEEKLQTSIIGDSKSEDSKVDYEISHEEMVKRHYSSDYDPDIENALLGLFTSLTTQNSVSIIMGTSVVSLLKRNSIDIPRRLVSDSGSIRDIDCILSSEADFKTFLSEASDLLGQDAVICITKAQYGPSLLCLTGIGYVRKVNIDLKSANVDCCSPLHDTIEKIISSGITMLSYDFIIPMTIKKTYSSELISPYKLFNNQQNCTATRMAYCQRHRKHSFTLMVSDRFHNLTSGPDQYPAGLFSLLRCIYTAMKFMGYKHGLNRKNDLIKLVPYPSKDDSDFVSLFKGDRIFREMAFWRFMESSKDFILFESPIEFATVCIAGDILSHNGIMELIYSSTSSFFDSCDSNEAKYKKFLRSLLRNEDVSDDEIMGTFRNEMVEHKCLNRNCIYCQSDIHVSAPIIVLPCGHIFHAACFLESFMKDYLIPMMQVKLLSHSVSDINTTAGKCPMCRGDCGLVNWDNVQKKLSQYLNFFWINIKKDNPNKKLLFDLVEKQGKSFSPLFNFGSGSFSQQMISLNSRGLELYKRDMLE